MLIKLFKLILILLFYQNSLYSKTKSLNDINSNILSDYLSGIVAYENKDNFNALKFFRSSKILIKNHDPYLSRYTNLLVLEGKVKQASNEIKQNINNNNTNFFEAYLILALQNIKGKNFKKSEDYLKRSYQFINNDKIALVIADTLKESLFVFEQKKLPNTKKNFGNFSLINRVFQKCYLEDKNTKSNFETIINQNDGVDYSRYLFFYIHFLIENNNYEEAKKITDDLYYLDLPLLISQGKKWIEDQKLEEFKKIFSCKNSDDIVSEFFFLVANLYLSQNNYEKSNFYLNISNYLNPKFSFNLSLLAENYYNEGDYQTTLKILENINKKNEIYHWFKLKKKAQIISNEGKSEGSINFMNSNFKKIKDPSLKIIFDMANLNKNAKKYKQAIKFYNQVISDIDINSPLYSEILYRRGGSYERMGDYNNADKDLLRSLEINSDDAYVLNYLAYSWLEREYKIETALQMLERAYEQKNNDPYIIDSIGWAYYLVDDYTKAEEFLKRAVELMPNDPTVNDHNGDILWKLDRRIQARYFWKNVLNLEETDEDMKKNINKKMTNGLKKS